MILKSCYDTSLTRDQISRPRNHHTASLRGVLIHDPCDLGDRAQGPCVTVYFTYTDDPSASTDEAT
jgi:hypothetical protein